MVVGAEDPAVAQVMTNLFTFLDSPIHIVPDKRGGSTEGRL